MMSLLSPGAPDPSATLLEANTDAFSRWISRPWASRVASSTIFCCCWLVTWPSSIEFLEMRLFDLEPRILPLTS